MKRIIVMAVGCVLGWSAAAQAEMGKAILSSTVSTTSVSGVVSLMDSPAGLHVDVEITQAPPGDHAFHIHEFGNCGDEGKAAGSHYNPKGHPHGNMLKDGVMKTHAGDFGSLKIDKNGKGALHVVIPGLALSTGETPVAGRALVLHEKADDFSQPTGNAGGRIGCGPILVTGK